MIRFVTTVQNNQLLMFDKFFEVVGEKFLALTGAPTLMAIKSDTNFEKLNFGLIFG